MPEGMQRYLRDFPWGLTTCIGGKWDWRNDESVSGGIAITEHELSQDLLMAIDEKLDDGNLDAGYFTANSTTCLFVLN